MSAPKEVLELVERFERNLGEYKNPVYSETEVRREFIDPFFKALGWDVDNRAGHAEAYKDVVHEDAVKVGGYTKAPDYSFRIGGTRKFFVEAKRPSKDLKQDLDPAFQVRRYAWSAKLPLSILTDFEEFVVYDCRVKPVKTDKASVARTLYIPFAEYADRWDEIADIFSKDALLKGSFDKYADTYKKKRGTAEVDEAFLVEIEGWRETLAKNLALRNKTLTRRELNFSVQRIIDRIIFLRICEDRGIEDYGALQSLVNGNNVYRRLGETFLNADGKYNSGLFHFKKEKDESTPPDSLTLGLEVDDKVLQNVIEGLYYPDSPYEFSVLTADILGQVYEQFLGKVIRLTAGHQAKIEEKPEVRKAGGVYYTPTYIVGYIVEQTVGELLKDKTPKKVEKLRIVDPACGSGSFLIGGYQRLLDWHLDWYLKDGTAKHAKAKRVFHARGNEWRLTTIERKRILLNNIYGVDIDEQAVEVTKLSLLLKVLEGVTGEILQRTLKSLHERVLPDLGDNIKCGNSLVGSDFYDGTQIELLDEEERYRINVFDWDREFPEIFSGKDPGFDVVIGNPPYGASTSDPQDVYFRQVYVTATGSLDSFGLFIEKAGELLTSGGRLGLIVQSAWVSAPSFSRLRKKYLSDFAPLVFVTLPYDVFGAYVDTIIAIASRTGQPVQKILSKTTPVDLIVFPPRFKIRSVTDFSRFAKTGDAATWSRGERDEFLVTLSLAEQRLAARIEHAGTRFGDVCDIQRGVTPFKTSETPMPVNSKRAFRGTVRRYKFDPGPEVYIRFDDSLAELKPERYFEGPRILLRELISRQFQLQAMFVDHDFVTNKSMQSLLLSENQYHMLYVLGLLNSSLMSWYFLSTQSVGRRDDFPKIVLKQTRGLPFRSIDFTAGKETDVHDQLTGLVTQMVELEQRVGMAKAAHDKTSLERQIAATDRQIDQLVYELYGLTDKEIKIVEDAVGQ